MPDTAGVRQARLCGAPLTLIRQSKHTPMPQKTPRSSPYVGVVRVFLRPAANKAAATLSP